MTIDVRQSRQETDCILVYVEDKSSAPKTWQQPTFDQYERDGCKRKFLVNNEVTRDIE